MAVVWMTSALAVYHIRTSEGSGRPCAEVDKSAHSMEEEVELFK